MKCVHYYSPTVCFRDSNRVRKGTKMGFWLLFFIHQNTLHKKVLYRKRTNIYSLHEIKTVCLTTTIIAMVYTNSKLFHGSLEQFSHYKVRFRGAGIPLECAFMVV